MTTVLIIDDDPYIRSAYQTICQKHGWAVLTADNGKKALEVLETSAPDIIISDVLMPIMGGLDFLEAYKAKKFPKPAKIIMLTNSEVPPDTEKRARELDVAAYRQKSNLSPDTLTELVKWHLKKA